MDILVAVLFVAFIPALAVVALARVGDSIRARREARYERQIAVTDAIHREMGAVAAPVVEKSLWGPERLRIVVDEDRPAQAARIVEVAQRAFAQDWHAPDEIVLVPRGR